MLKLLMLALSGAKLGKLLTTGGTMIISVVVYAFIFGWKYAVGFVGLILVHEMGHYRAARYRGLDVGALKLPLFDGRIIVSMRRNYQCQKSHRFEVAPF